MGKKNPVDLQFWIEKWEKTPKNINKNIFKSSRYFNKLEFLKAQTKDLKSRQQLLTQGTDRRDEWTVFLNKYSEWDVLSNSAV